MKILLTNDDGINAEGINVLADVLESAGHKIYVIAPEQEKSASSHSITLSHPLRINETGPGRYSVSGSPADCIILGFEVILKEKVDLVISGINRGQNLCEDVLYSGTVAAAVEAMYFGYPSIAVSLVLNQNYHYTSAAEVIKNLLSRNIHNLISRGEILNINVPDIALDQIAGYRITRTGHRKYQDFIKKMTDPRGRPVYWVGCANPVWDNTPGTDSHAVMNNLVSITPITIDFTNLRSFEKLENFIKKTD